MSYVVEPMAAAPATAQQREELLELRQLEVEYAAGVRSVRAVDGIDLELRRGETLGLVGESGCGKSTTALAVVRYLPRNGRVRAGSIRVAGSDVLSLSREQVRRLRAERVSMVYQNPADALNPTLRMIFMTTTATLSWGSSWMRSTWPILTPAISTVAPCLRPAMEAKRAWTQ